VLENKQLVSAANRVDSITNWLYHMVKEMDPASPGRMMRQAENLTAELNRLGNLSKQTNWEERFQYYEKRLETTLDQANVFLTKMDSTLDSVPLEELYTDLEKAVKLMERADQLMKDISSTLDDAKNQDVLAGRLLYDKSLSADLDSTIFHLNETLKQIHRRKVVVGFRRKGE